MKEAFIEGLEELIRVMPRLFAASAMLWIAWRLVNYAEYGWHASVIGDTFAAFWILRRILSEAEDATHHMRKMEKLEVETLRDLRWSSPWLRKELLADIRDQPIPAATGHNRPPGAP